MLKVGGAEKLLGLATQRVERLRLWCSLERCVAHLKAELDITRIDLGDARRHQAESASPSKRSDAAERMRQPHHAAAYEGWFCEQVRQRRLIRGRWWPMRTPGNASRYVALPWPNAQRPHVLDSGLEAARFGRQAAARHGLTRARFAMRGDFLRIATDAGPKSAIDGCTLRQPHSIRAHWRFYLQCRYRGGLSILHGNTLLESATFSYPTASVAAHRSSGGL